MRKYLVGLFILLFFIIPPHQAFAQADWGISSFHSDLKLREDGSVDVLETINVNFSIEKHGIFRDIPYAYQTSDSNTKYTSLTVNSVQRDGKSEKYSVTTNEANKRIIIGDKSRTITGNHEYQITYTVVGVIVPYPTYDELYWNVTGNNWEVPIQKSSAIFSLPKPGLIQTACYFGIKGSTTQCRDEKVNEHTAAFSTDTLQAGEGMTVAAGFQKGLVPVITVDRPKTFFEKIFEPLNIFLFLVLAIGGTGSVIAKWLKEGRDYWGGNILLSEKSTQGKPKPFGKHESIVVEFMPPDNLRPAEMGVVMDERSDTLDITATLIDLARRGFVSIEEVKKKWLLGRSDYILHRLSKISTQLLPYEKELLTRLFEKGKDISLSNLKLTFYDDLREVKDKLYTDVTEKNIFPSNPEKIRQKYLIIGILVTFLPVVLFYFTGLFFVAPILVSIGSAVSLTGLALVIFSGKMPRRSAYGHDLYRRSLGYRLFISGAEKYRQRFYEQQNLFDEILPYAIIFGLTAKFAKAMREIGVKPSQPTWYIGLSPFNPVAFASSMNTFSKSLSTTMAAAPSSSGSGGGGSSGGGFGGGGGGSW